VPFFNWLFDTRKVPYSLVAGQPTYARDLEGERPDPRRIPDPRQLREIAAVMGEAHGSEWETYVLLSGYCALRISEALDVRLESFERRNGRWWLNVAMQEHRAVAACSDTGTTKERTRTKATRRRTPAPRLVPIPNQLLEHLEAEYGLKLGTTDARLFVGPRGGVSNASVVRGWWDDAVEQLFGDNPRLAGIKPHSLRHAGMTYWFAAPNADEKKIQIWGGWTSLTQMLDTYRGVIDSLEEVSLDGLDEFVEQFAKSDTRSEAARSGEVVSMSQWTAHRGRVG
jgi:integrase